MRKPVPKPKVYTPPRNLISIDDSSGILLPSFSDGGRVVTLMREYDIPLLALTIADPPSWANEKIHEDFGEPRLRQVMVFGDISDPDLLGTSLFARETGYDVFAIPSNPNFNDIHSLLSWMSLRDNSVGVLSLKMVVARLKLVQSAPKDSSELETL
ncbi:MAG: hypothetical protein COA43_14485 [Robiginitomaculum sp.]|nr:MAG: hypothetical protein COA43_14485 [Robiginitomaculum sp.]